jgi:hypothetical protein
MVGEMLEPLFEAIYPEHPYFVETLTPEIVEKFVRSLSENDSPDQSAMTYGVALGIVEFGDTGFSVLPKEKLREAPYAASVIRSIEASGETDVSVLEAELLKPPVGLTLEAVRLILSAMAHRGLIELVTTERERVNGRSIDLKLDWSNIVAADFSRSVKNSDSKLLEWARLVCNDESITSFSDAEDRAKILAAFVEISSQWERRNPFEPFEAIPDCALNTKIWRHSNKTWEPYTAMVASVNETLVGNITVEEGLDAICNDFLAQPSMFQKSWESITALEDFGRTRPEIDRITNYLAIAETSNDSEVEAARNKLRTVLRSSEAEPTDQTLRDLGYCWEKFLRLYTEHYIELHAPLSRPMDFRRFAQDALGPDRTADLFKIRAEKGNDRRQREGFREIRRRLGSYYCSLDPTPFLQTTPFCKCGFQPSAASLMEVLSGELHSLVPVPEAG